MSVLYWNNRGWILDHQQFISDTFKDMKGDANTKFSYKKGLFEINNPFMMDSEFKAKFQQTTIDKIDDSKRQDRKKQKRKAALNEGEIKAKELHDHYVKFILPAYKSLIEEIKDQTIFAKSNDIIENNTKARELASSLGPGDSIRDSCKTDIDDEDISTHVLTTGSVYGNISNQLLCSTENSPMKIKVLDNIFLIPPNCSFVLADVKNLNHFTAMLGKFDLILLDPPWQNKSVKRKKQYWTLQNEDLFSIPVPELSTPGCIIGVWVTNRVKHREFVIEELFPYWKIKYITTWYWLKVTKSGEMVYDIYSDHKKPYEVLILGMCQYKFNGKVDKDEEIASPSQTSLHRKDLPLNQTIISVPSSIHSMKVPLIDIIAAYLPANPKCLEIFARNLQTGWVSFGNEVYKHNHVDYFEKT